jgi:hypothetical protein
MFSVHFFVTRQKNEPKKTRVGVAPLRTLLLPQSLFAPEAGANLSVIR